MLEAQQVGGLLNHLNTFDGHSWRLRKKKKQNLTRKVWRWGRGVEVGMHSLKYKNSDYILLHGRNWFKVTQELVGEFSSEN